MSRFHNRTRTSKSIPRKLLRVGKPYLIPVYWVMQLSTLAREGIANSGSYRFADHIYGMKPSGRFGVGRVLDALLLRLRSARSMRTRYIYAKREIHALIRERTASGGEAIDILAVPCGLGRELFEIREELEREAPALLPKARLHGIDLDRELIDRLRARSRKEGYDIRFRSGDALQRDTYPQRYDIILCTGFTEFLEDSLAVEFYRMALEHLNEGGCLITSGLDRHPFSDYLMRNLGELHANYRTETQLKTLVGSAGFEDIVTYQDENKLQTMIIATRSKHVSTQRHAEAAAESNRKVG